MAIFCVLPLGTQDQPQRERGQGPKGEGEREGDLGNVELEAGRAGSAVVEISKGRFGAVSGVPGQRSAVL